MRTACGSPGRRRPRRSRPTWTSTPSSARASTRVSSTTRAARSTPIGRPFASCGAAKIVAGDRVAYMFVHREPVRFRDLDAMGHVNNAVFLTYIESARFAYLLHLGAAETLEDMNIIVARIEIDF